MDRHPIVKNKKDREIKLEYSHDRLMNMKVIQVYQLLVPDKFWGRNSEGQIETVLIYSPDRLSRKYAYQVLLTEEFSRYGTDVIFIKSPKATTPEEHLLLQFQGMIAEYERAQIIERTRRGKKHRAKMGSINVLSGAPYGYLYVKKTEYTSVYYKIILEADY